MLITKCFSLGNLSSSCKNRKEGLVFDEVATTVKTLIQGVFKALAFLSFRSRHRIDSELRI